MTRALAVWRRWRDILLLAAAGYSVILLAARTSLDCSALIATPGWISLAAVILVITLSYNAAQGHLLAWTGLRHLPFYPPAWIAGILGFILLVAHIAVLPGTPKAFACPGETSWPLGQLSRAIGLLFGVGVTSLGAAWLIARTLADRGNKETIRRTFAMIQSPRGAHRVTSAALAGDFTDLERWLATDTPITEPCLDAFNHAPIASRISRHLRSPARPTVALAGPVGSGKTSIAQLVRRELAEAGLLGGSVSIVRVSVWPYDNVDAALRGLLGAITSELAHHINTTPLRGLSSDYAEAVAALASRWATFGQFLRTQRSPSDILGNFDAAARAIDLRIVLWVEDLERFAGASIGTVRASSDKTAPVRALLAEFGTCSS